MVRETVRIGLAIRRREVRFRLHGDYAVTGVEMEHAPLLKEGEYRAVVEEAASFPVWGARVHTFETESGAHSLRRELKRKGVYARVVPMGRSANWGDAGVYEAVTWGVVVGEFPNPESAITAARNQLAAIPMDIDSPPVKGMKRYEDEIPRVEPIRLHPPRGGEVRLECLSDDREWTFPSPLQLRPSDPKTTFELAAVRIGIEFHWDHEEQLTFRGDLDIVADGESLTVVNEVELDEYLAAVLGSEMRSDWPVEALAAQAVAARSTVLATRGKHHYGEAFDLCHDDHCQCYQGVGRESETALKALERAHGKLLIFGNRVVDARYAKSCGGLSDYYHVAWDDWSPAYLSPVPCGPVDGKPVHDISFSLHGGSDNLYTFIENPPDWAACNPDVVKYPESSRDMEDLYRWNVRLEPAKLSALIEQRTGRSLGRIHDLVPLERGISGRIRFLKVVGEYGTLTVGKELNIRRLLSDSHLPSSAFAVIPESDGGFKLEGIGWGHGVGMCQLGAAALAEQGWPAERLLSHYYPGTRLVEA